MLKSLRFIPLCVLIFSGYAFAEDYGNHSSDSDAAKRVAAEVAAAKAAAAFGVDDLFSDFKSGVNGSKSGVGVGSYTMVIRDVIKNRLGDSLDIYKGKKCLVKIGLLRDGTVVYVVDYAGDSDLCNTVTLAVRGIKFPPPPSEHIYQAVKDGILDFNP